MPERVSGVAQFVEQYGGWLVGLLTVLGTIFYNSRKVQVDESALVLGKWKDLVEAHQSQISTLNAELTALRERLLKAEERIRQLEDENAGLRRSIIQNSQSAVVELGKVKRRNDATKADLDDLAGRFNDVGHNSDGGTK